VQAVAYERRRPETTDFYQVVRKNLETFLAEARARDPEGRGVPKYVSQALRRFLDCGILQKGFARVRCPSCRAEMLVGFS
jgi:hypothetical protein